MKIDDLKDQFLDYLVENRGRSQNTKKAYDFDLTKFINYLKSQEVIEVELVSTRIIEEYLFKLSSSTVTKQRNKCSIIN